MCEEHRIPSNPIVEPNNPKINKSPNTLPISLDLLPRPHLVPNGKSLLLGQVIAGHGRVGSLLSATGVDHSGAPADSEEQEGEDGAQNNVQIPAARLLLLHHCRIMTVIVNNIDLNGGFGIGGGGGRRSAGRRRT